MKDYLLDIVQHTHGLGVVDLVKVTGNEEETTLDAIDNVNKLVIVKAKFNNPIPDFVGQFGMPNLGKLKTILGIEEYKEDAVITVTKDSAGAPDGIKFENKNNDFKNEYRLMSASVVSAQIQSSRIVREPKWSVEFTPTAAGIQKLRFQASANSEESFFIAKTEDSNLKFFFGDHSSHAGDFVFHPGVVGTMTKQWKWPVSVIINILSLPGDKSYKIDEAGLTEITVDSGLATYRYLIPAQTK
jgi:hypothetical protein